MYVFTPYVKFMFRQEKGLTLVVNTFSYKNTKLILNMNSTDDFGS